MTWATIAVILVLLFVIALLTVGEGILKVTAGEQGANPSNFSILPSTLGAFFGKSSVRPQFVPADAEIIHLNKGFDINLAGKAKEESIERVMVSHYIIKPTDFLGMSPIPKVLVEVGGTVKAGDPLFYDKKRPEIIYCAPVSGELTEIRRGEKRLINAIVILADKEVQYKKTELQVGSDSKREEIVSVMTQNGLWPYLRQRPYDMVPEPLSTPNAIFLSTFDTAPLSPNLNLAVAGKEDAFLKGIEILTKLSGSQVHLGLSANQSKPADAYLKAAEMNGVSSHWFNGPHPAGNVGIQMHHTAPVLPGTQMWYTDVHGVIVIGQFFLHGIYDTERVVALTGSVLSNPRYVKVHQGATVQQLLEDMSSDFEMKASWVKKDGKNVQENVEQRVMRIISGDVLSGKQIERSGSLGFYDDQITVVKEGNYYEMFGWLLPQTSHPTQSRTFTSAAFSDLEFEADTNTNGEKRAFVMTGEYESVLPMDIYPQHLFRAIMCNDLEKMEGLGILELGEEDVALCEYVCTSKQPLQAMLREGLETMRNS